MALLDDLNTASLLDSKFNKRCGMCRLLEKLSPAEAEKVVELMNNPDIAKSKLTRVLQQNGHHRLFAKWLLGQDTAPVWKVEL